MEYKFINPEYIDSVSSGDNSIIFEIVKLFEEQVPEVLSEMKTLLGQKKYYDLGLLAHKAKSSVAIMGMAELAQMLKTFELQAKESCETEKYASYIDRFEKETSEAIRELGHLVSTLQKH